MVPILALSGNIAAGKTTLAHKLTGRLAAVPIPRRGYDESYIEDQLLDPSRWTFEAQMAFLGHKARALREVSSLNRYVVLDRTIQEDINVFARRFADMGYMDKRAVDTYMAYARLLTSDLPEPTLIVYCDCPPALSLERLRDRPRGYQRLYSSGHMEALHKMSLDWIRTYTKCPVVTVKTSAVRSDSQVVNWLANHFRETVEGAADSQIALPLRIGSSNAQVPLFPKDERVGPPVGVRLGPPPFDSSELSNGMASVDDPRARSMRPMYPRIYLAAPFTTLATEGADLDSERSPSLFRAPALYGGIAPGKYRNALEAACAALERRRFAVYLPHRDLNGWGAVRLSAREIADGCIDAVRQADLLIAILGESFGSHFEFGLAMGLGKPVVGVRTRDVRESFMAGALLSGDRAPVLEVETLEELPGAIEAGALEPLISAARTRYGPHRERD